MQKQIDLALKVRQDIDSLHRAINQIRALRTNLNTLQQWVGDGAANQGVIQAAKSLDQKMSPVEAQLMQVKMKSSEGNLRYPNMLNEQYATFNNIVQGVDGAPTQQQLLVFDELHGRLTTLLAAWQEVIRTEIPALNEQMRKHGVPNITVASGEAE